MSAWRAYWERLVADGEAVAQRQKVLPAPSVQAPKPDLYYDDHMSELADEWLAEQREFERADYDEIWREKL